MEDADKPASLAIARLQQLDYWILSGRRADAGLKGLHDHAFELWKTNWLKTFAELKSDAKLKADDFVRQDVISALFHGDEAVGLLLHTRLDLTLEAIREHTYLSTYPPRVLEGLVAEDRGEVWSMEYLTLSSRWKKSMVSVPLAEVILGLGAKVLEATGMRSMIVVTRNERRVNEILYGYGARCLVPNLTKHNVAVDLVSLDKGTTHGGPNPEVNRWIDFYWAKRKDCVGLDKLAAAPGSPKKAA